MEATETEVKKDHVITGEPIVAPVVTHDIRIELMVQTV
jgi:hypothetical protein